MYSGGDGVLFGRQTKCVVTHRVQNVEPFEAFVPSINVGSNVPEWVSYVQSGPRRVWKHVQYIKLGAIALVAYFVNFVLIPVGSPLFLNFAWLVFHILGVVRQLTLNAVILSPMKRTF